MSHSQHDHERIQKCSMRDTRGGRIVCDFYFLQRCSPIPKLTEVRWFRSTCMVPVTHTAKARRWKKLILWVPIMRGFHAFVWPKELSLCDYRAWHILLWSKPTSCRHRLPGRHRPALSLQLHEHPAPGLAPRLRVLSEQDAGTCLASKSQQLCSTSPPPIRRSVVILPLYGIQDEEPVL